MSSLKLLRFESVIVKDRKGEEFLIRKYEHPKDREKLIEMYLKYDPNFRCLGLPPTNPVAIKSWIDYLAENGFAIVAEKDGKFVGHLAIVPTERNEVSLTIFIHQNYQNRGLGQEMIKIIIEICKKANFDAITLVTERKNERAIHVYRKLGFEIVAPYFEYDMRLSLK
ncbi:MAG: GNAT family N-acetyltransferase [Archaeoglobaceae archaeon]|nr:GNAT family N-acetyltransferase [Archaeoglobaceae archaeon]